MSLIVFGNASWVIKALLKQLTDKDCSQFCVLYFCQTWNNGIRTVILQIRVHKLEVRETEQSNIGLLLREFLDTTTDYGLLHHSCFDCFIKLIRNL